MNVSNLRGVLTTSTEAVVGEIAKADIVAISIGQQGLEKRRKLFETLALDVIIRKTA